VRPIGRSEADGEAGGARFGEGLVEELDGDADGLLDLGAARGELEERGAAAAGEGLAALQADEGQPEAFGEDLAAGVAPAPDLVGGDVEDAAGAVAHGEDGGGGGLSR
jgi:hypothetical protein